MKALKFLFRTYCMICGLIVGPAIAAILVANAFGTLPGDRIASAIALLRGELTQPATTAAEAPSASEAERQRPTDIRSWEGRLQSMQRDLVQDVDGLERAIGLLEQEESRLHSVGKSLQSVLTTVLGREVSLEELLSSAQELTDQLNRISSEKERMPRLLETLKSVEPATLASILTQPGVEGEEMTATQKAELLGGLSPRRAAEVLTEMGKLNPASAARMVALLGGLEAPTQRSE